MNKTNKLIKDGLSMFNKAVKNLEEANKMMLSKEMRNSDAIVKLEIENVELHELRTKNNKIIENIKNIID